MKLMNLVDFFGNIFVHEWYLYTLCIYIFIAYYSYSWIYKLLAFRATSGKINNIIIEKSLKKKIKLKNFVCAFFLSKRK